jgi:hypothetical protein
VGCRPEASYCIDAQIGHVHIQKEFALAVILGHALHAVKEQLIIGQKNQSTYFQTAHISTSPLLCLMFCGTYLKTIENVLIV